MCAPQKRNFLLIKHKLHYFNTVTWGLIVTKELTCMYSHTNQPVICATYSVCNFAQFGSSLIVMNVLNYGMLINVLVIFKIIVMLLRVIKFYSHRVADGTIIDS